MILRKLFVLIAVAGCIGLANAETGKPVPPAAEREFRGAWVATVANIDWPSRQGLSSADQQKELVAILDQAQKLNLNAIIFQARPACDALYASEFEPWSEYITGTMGKAPEPFYDPLKLAVDEAHKRGIELHVWLNPYRAHHSTGKSEISAQHVSKKHPEMVVPYGSQLWLDPGQKAVQDYTLGVILDLVKRYDIDGVHFDDYFYPYPEVDGHGTMIPFPDDKSWKAYLDGGGKLSRDDWRRDNVNSFIEHVYKSIKTTKPWVKFGISPFGIWQPNYPQGITSSINIYETLYCDSRKWLTNGWCDYFAPQLYWKIEQTAQSYPVLLNWWTQQNIKQRNLWAGNFTSKVPEGWTPDEIVNQVKLTRDQKGASGNIHFSMKPLMQNRGQIADILKTKLYNEPALVPAFPWLNNHTVAKPTFDISADHSGVKVSWQSGEAETVWQWVLQTKSAGKWKTEILPSQEQSRLFAGRNSLPDAVAITAINRYGNASSPAVFGN